MFKRKSQFKMKIVASEGPGFGAYLKGSAADGEAFIMLNVLACLAADIDPRTMLAETLAHEVLHACQDAMGVECTEADIEKALARIEGVELEVYENEEQMTQNMINEITRLRDVLQQIVCLPAKADELKRWAKEALDKK